MQLIKKNIILFSTLALTLNSFGMLPSIESTKNISANASAGISASVSTVCKNAWSKKGYLGAAAVIAGLLYGGYKAYEYQTHFDVKSLYTAPSGHILQVEKSLGGGSLRFIFKKTTGEESQDCITDSHHAETATHSFKIGKITGPKAFRELNFTDRVSSADLIIIHKTNGNIVSMISNIQDLL